MCDAKMCDDGEVIPIPLCRSGTKNALNAKQLSLLNPQLVAEHNCPSHLTYHSCSRYRIQDTDDLVSPPCKMAKQKWMSHSFRRCMLRDIVICTSRSCKEPTRQSIQHIVKSIITIYEVSQYSGIDCPFVLSISSNNLG